MSAPAVPARAILDAETEMEEALLAVKGLFTVLLAVDRDLEAEAVAYLASRLQEHYERAHAAFECLHRLNRVPQQ